MKIATCDIHHNMVKMNTEECRRKLFLHEVDLVVFTGSQSSFVMNDLENQTRTEYFRQKTFINLLQEESWRETFLPDKRLTILGIQLSGQNQVNQPITQRLLDYLKENAAERVIVVGNLRIKPTNFLTAFEFKQYFQSVAFQGWVEAWRFLHPLTYEHFWFSNAKRGLSFNFIILAPALKNFLISSYQCSFSSKLKDINKVLFVELTGINGP